MKLDWLLFSVALVLPLSAQSTTQGENPWAAFSFLEGAWVASTVAGSEAKVAGTYVFQKELRGHIIARHATVSGCTGPKAFDCQHGDLLYLFQDAPGQAIKAIYLDNEGHVIHYGVTTPDSTTVVFLSEPGPGPRFRLTYHLDGKVMFGKFQTQMPDQEEWKSYLEWNGSRR